jgi:PAS domain S-box-containing protein
MIKTSILIVEDEAIVAADLTAKLKRLGYEVVGTAAQGEAAVDMADRLRPHLVLMDIHLEGPTDGIAAAQEIQRQHSVPVIYLTAHSDAATLARAKLTGPFGYILKPFDERDLATQIELAIYKHQADRQLREQREWLRVTLTSIGDAVIATDDAGRITFVNPVAESLTGWKSEEATGQLVPNIFRIVNEQDGRTIEDPVACVLRKGCALALGNHIALVTRDNRIVPIEDSAAPIKDAAGRVIGAVLVFHDVTEKRRATEALRASEEKFRTAFANAAIGFAMKTPEGGFIDANPSYCKLTGYEVAELRTMIFPQLIHPDDFPQYKNLIDRMLAGQISDFVIESRYMRKIGELVWVRKSVSLVRDAQNAPQWIIALVEDASERKHAEEALRALNKTLEQQVAERTGLAEARTRQLQTLAVELIEAEERERRRVAELLHDDLQQILAAAKMQLQAVCETLSPEPILTNVAQLLEESIAKSRRLSHDLSPAVLHHSGLIAALQWLGRQMGERYGLQVKMDFQAQKQFENTPVKVFLFRAVHELLFNIVKHAGVKNANVALCLDDDRLVIEVGDEGRGFNPEHWAFSGSGFGLLSGPAISEEAWS